MTEIITIGLIETTEMMTDMKEMIDKIEETGEMITTEMTEMKEDMIEMENMAVGTADQEMVFEDTARRLEAKESLLQVHPWLLDIPSLV